MILPAGRLVICSLVLFTASVIVIALPAITSYFLIAGAILAFLALVDLFSVCMQAFPRIQREVLHSLPINIWHTVTLKVIPASAIKQKIELYDNYPDYCECHAFPAKVRIASKDESPQFNYRLKPLKRGELSFGKTFIRLFSPLGLWIRQTHSGEPMLIRVYPNFQPIAQMALQTTVFHNALGLQKQRRRGQGMDFEQLREYRPGDAMRQIDWKATTRLNKMISREYQDERNQRILLMIDCGRRMSAGDHELSHFDHSLNAALLLSYVGLRYGDAVGMMTLGGPERFLSPKQSMSTVNRIMHEIYDLQPTLNSSDFESAAQHLLSRERKRALVVILTNLRDEDEQNLLSAVMLLRKHHLVLVASLREMALDRAAETTIKDVHHAALRASAAEYQARRQAIISRLTNAGVLCLDVPPQNLAVESVNRYLAVKAAGQL